MGTAVYLRISEDKLGLELGVDRQRRDCRGLADQRGWSEVAEFVDNDISASNGKRRPAYAALLTAIERGEVTRVIVWHQSRLWRNRRERADGIELLKRHQVTLVCVRGPELDMSTAYGRGVAGLIGEFDTMESDTNSERVRRSIQQRAERGLWHGGKRLYGYTGDRSALVPAEAAAVAGWFREFAAGRTLGALARDAGVGPATMRARLRNPAYAGIRMYGGRELPAAWPAIVTRDQWQAAVRTLADPGRVTNGGKGGPGNRAALLSGLASCERCGRKVYSGSVSDGRPGYRCLSWLGGCGRSWHRGRVDAYVVALVEERLARPDLADLLPRNRPDLDALREEAAGIRGRLRTLGRDFVRLGLDGDQVAEANRDGRARLAEIEAAVGESMRGTVLGELVACEDPVELWRSVPAGQIDRRQAIIRAVMSITLGKPPAGGQPRDWETSVARYGDRCVKVGPPAAA